jgi:hypothetical protein
MSGFPLQSPADASKYRQIYLSNLNLQASNDEKNLVANQLYKKTGEVPVQPPDTRTTSQKYQDLNGVKMDATSMLSQIMDGDEVRDAVNRMSRGELTFYTQYATAINNDVLTKFRLGMRAVIFLPYLRKYMRKQIETEGVEYGLQQSTGENILLSTQNIYNDMLTPADLGPIAHMVGGALGRGNAANAYILQLLHELQMSMPDHQDIQDIHTIQNAELREALLRDLTHLTRAFPSRVDLGRVMDRMRMAEEAGDRVAFQTELKQMEGLLDIGKQNVLDLSKIRSLLSQLKKGDEKLQSTLGGYASSVADAEEFEIADTPVEHAKHPLDMSSARAVLSLQPTGYAPSGYGSTTSATETPIPTPVPAPAGVASRQTELNTDFTLPSANVAVNMSKSQLQELFHNFEELAHSLKESRFWDDMTEHLDTQDWEELKMFFGQKKTRDHLVRLLGLRKGQTGKGISKRKPRISGKGVLPTKVPAVDRYGRIGNHIIKLLPLEKNILTINTPNGWAVKGLPSKIISTNLVKVFKEMVGEGVPKYSSIEDLTEEEKDFLNKIARITKIEDRVKVKTPNKTDLDKLVNRFEILKGEICAGNNNKELVKEFKKTIITLSNEGMLPKGQAREILMDLVSLGF